MASVGATVSTASELRSRSCIFGTETLQLGQRTRLDRMLQIFAATNIQSLGDNFYPVCIQPRKTLQLKQARRELLPQFREQR